MVREWHGCTPGYLGLYLYLYPVWQVGFSDGCGQVQPLKTRICTHSRYTHRVWAGSEHRQGWQWWHCRVRATALLLLLSLHVAIVALLHAWGQGWGQGDWWTQDDDNDIIVWGQHCCHCVIGCARMREGEDEGDTRTMVMMTMTLSCRGNKVIIVVLLDAWGWGQGQGKVCKDESNDYNIIAWGQQHHCCCCCCCCVVRGARMRVRVRVRKGNGIQWWGLLSLLCCWTHEDEGQGKDKGEGEGGQWHARMRTTTTTTTTTTMLLHKGNNVIVIVVIVVALLHCCCHVITRHTRMRGWGPRHWTWWGFR